VALKWRLMLLVVVHGAQRLLTWMALLHSLFLASSYHYEVLPTSAFFSVFTGHYGPLNQNSFVLKFIGCVRELLFVWAVFGTSDFRCISAMHRNENIAS